MIQQSIAQFTRNAQKATSIVDDKLPDRQRGMWSFLTWSFFLAQAVAAHEAFAKGHAGGDAGADADGSGSGNGDDAAQKGMPSASMLGVSGFDVDPAAAAQFAAAIAAGLVTPQMLAGFQADPALFQAFVDQLTGNASAAFGDVAAAGAAADLAAAREAVKAVKDRMKVRSPISICPVSTFPAASLCQSTSPSISVSSLDQTSVSASTSAVSTTSASILTSRRFSASISAWTATA